MNPLPHRRVGETGKPGIVTGLAWTPVGGDILYIQTLLTGGNGKITVTGQLGDVMKESAQIAVSLVKAMLPGQAAALAESDLHIHVPDGATPKGDVNPIGGLPEKLMAAQRSGVKKVFIPRDNADDLKDVAPEVLSALEIVPVADVTEVLLALDIPVEPAMPRAM